MKVRVLQTSGNHELLRCCHWWVKVHELHSVLLDSANKIQILKWQSLFLFHLSLWISKQHWQIDCLVKIQCQFQINPKEANSTCSGSTFQSDWNPRMENCSPYSGSTFQTCESGTSHTKNCFKGLPCFSYTIES